MEASLHSYRWYLAGSWLTLLILFTKTIEVRFIHRHSLSFVAMNKRPRAVSASGNPSAAGAQSPPRSAIPIDNVVDAEIDSSNLFYS